MASTMILCRFDVANNVECCGPEPKTTCAAEQNLANRETGRSVALAVKAAEATGRYAEACTLERDHGPSVQVYLDSLNRVLVR